MNAFDAALSDDVTIRCPTCGASETANAASLAGAPRIVCRNCGETWPAFAAGTKRRDAEQQPGPEVRTLDAMRRPLVTYSAGEGRAWAAKAEADRLPKARRATRITSIAAGMAALLFIGAFIGGREAAVGALPDLAGLYAAIGLPVNLDGLRIEEVAAERSAGSDSLRLVVRGTIVNVSGSEQVVPPLVASLRDSALRPAGSFRFDMSAAIIAAGESERFELELPAAPRQASDVLIRFSRASEPPAQLAEAATAAP